MIQELSKIANIPFDEKNEQLMAHLRRVERKMPLKCVVDVRNKDFKTSALLAFVAVYKEGPEAPVVKETLDGPRVLKIKSVPKGDRLETIAPNGIRYSFGPKWNDSVIRGKGIAVSEANREKLNYQATLVGVVGDAEMIEQMSTKDLAAKIAALL